MANINTYGIRFSEEKYATKNEVIKDMGTSLIDGIWNGILQYRSTFYHYLTIKTIEKGSQLFYCPCPGINAKVNSAEAKLLRLMREYNKLSPFTGDLNRFEQTCVIKSLKSIASIHNYEVNDQYLLALINNQIKEDNQQSQFLKRYYNALTYIKEGYVNNVDDNFLADLYAKILGVNELTSFYRQKDLSSRDNKVLVSRIYASAPAHLVNEMMDKLFAFISSSSMSNLVKAFVVIFYINYVKPFTEYSEEISVLMAKAILAHFDLGECGAIFPFEAILENEMEEANKVFQEVQKTSDVTYIVTYMLAFFDKKMEELFDIIATNKASSLKADFFKKDEEIKEENSIINQAPTDTFNKKEENKIESIKVNEESNEKIEEVASSNLIGVKSELAISVPDVYDEKAAQRLEDHLLETDPSIKKGEAYFYARHCTIGKIYTIAMYKKALKCVYETARTSMDHLVSLHYYRKEAYKNKYVYTPIKKD